jgi:hypothetical protein
MRKMKVLAICAIAVLSVTSAKAQFATGADVVSSYVWRGIPQEDPTGVKGGSPNIQPYVSFTTGKLTLGSWASSSFAGALKEVDLYATYAFSSAFAITLTDYDFNFGYQANYFKYSGGTPHIFEGTLAYTGPAFSASINTMFAGADKKPSDASKQALSTYIELGYQINPLAKVFAGGVLGASNNYFTTKAGVTNVGLKVSKSIAITDKFSLPVYGIVGANPYAKTTFFVAGITL